MPPPPNNQRIKILKIDKDLDIFFTRQDVGILSKMLRACLHVFYNKLMPVDTFKQLTVSKLHVVVDSLRVRYSKP